MYNYKLQFPTMIFFMIYLFFKNCKLIIEENNVFIIFNLCYKIIFSNIIYIYIYKTKISIVKSIIGYSMFEYSLIN